MKNHQEKNKKIYPRDIFNAGYCATGLVAGAQAHGINYRQWVKNGLSVSELEKLNDAQVDRIIKEVLGAINGQE